MRIGYAIPVWAFHTHALCMDYVFSLFHTHMVSDTFRSHIYWCILENLSLGLKTRFYAIHIFMSETKILHQSCY